MRLVLRTQINSKMSVIKTKTDDIKEINNFYVNKIGKNIMIKKTSRFNWVGIIFKKNLNCNLRHNLIFFRFYQFIQPGSEFYKQSDAKALKSNFSHLKQIKIQFLYLKKKVKLSHIKDFFP